MSQSKIDIKNCPFCGYEAGVIDWGTEGPSDEYAEDWQIQCCHCGASPLEDWAEKAAAIKAWNARPAEDELKQRVKILEWLLSHLKTYAHTNYNESPHIRLLTMQSMLLHNNEQLLAMYEQEMAKERS